MKLKMFYIITLITSFLILTIILLAGYFLPSYNEDTKNNTYNFIDVKGIRIHYLYNNKPQQENLVFLHSFGGNLQMWDTLISYLSDYNIFAYDMPGFGKSDKTLSDYSLNTQTAFLDSLLNIFNLDSVILIGSSMGASTAVSFAARFPERVKKIILISPSGYPGSMNHKFPGNYFYKPGLLNKIGKLITGNILFKSLFPGSLAFQAFSVTSSYDSSYVEKLRKINIPVLIFWSKGDYRTLYEYSSIYLKLLSNAKLITIDDEAKHNINSYKPDLISSEIINFLNK